MIKIIKIALILPGLFILSITTLNLFLSSFNFGFIMIGAASCFLIVYGLLFERLSKIKWLTVSILTGGTFFLGVVLFLSIYGNNSTATFNEEAVIVLGAGIRGETVSRILAYRLDKAIEYSLKNPDAIIIVSGGQGQSPREYITEALAMKRYLVDNGIPEERIIKEESSTSTYENLLFSKEILDSIFDKPYRVVIITNNFHIFRSAQLARSLGLDVTHSGARIARHSIPLNYSREFAAVMRMWVLGR